MHAYFSSGQHWLQRLPHIFVPDKPGLGYVHVCHAHDRRDPQALGNRAPWRLCPRPLAVRSQEPWVEQDTRTEAQKIAKGTFTKGKR